VSDPKVIRVHRRLADGRVTFILGDAVRYYPDGWRFVPNVSGRSISRKYWATWEACLPRWVGYPDRCETEIIL
jgi:hypothetical protein